MEILTVTFFGHREINDYFEVERKLTDIIRKLLQENEYVEFLVGRDGEFDQLVSSTIRTLRKQYDYGNSTLILVLPYMRAEYRDNEQSFLDYYDEIEICSESADAHFKAALQIRNRSMVDRSDMVICCIEHKSGGAYKTVKYARDQGKEIINISENADTV